MERVLLDAIVEAFHGVTTPRFFRSERGYNAQAITNARKLLARHPGLDNCVRLCIFCEVSYEWDASKADVNLRKHGVDFADAVTALEDELTVTIRDLHSEEENRFITLGMDGLGRLLVVVYTWRGDAIRVISARKATRRERQQY